MIETTEIMELINEWTSIKTERERIYSDLISHAKIGARYTEYNDELVKKMIRDLTEINALETKVVSKLFTEHGISVGKGLALKVGE